MDIEKEEGIYLTQGELKNLNRLFNIIGVEALKANYFTKSDIDDIYSVMEKVRIGLDEITLHGGND